MSKTAGLCQNTDYLQPTKNFLKTKSRYQTAIKVNTTDTRLHRCRSRQNFWGAKDFCTNFPERDQNELQKKLKSDLVIFTKTTLLGVRLHPFSPASYTTARLELFIAS